MGPNLTLNGLTALVQPELDRINRELLEDLRPRERDLLPLVKHVAGYQGKQLRPVLVFLAGKAVGSGEIRTEHHEVAKVVELLHTATLVHDDVLDGAGMRRRIPTVNALEGAEVAVLLGDYIYAKAFHMAVSLEDVACARWLAETVRVICQGEITQILHRFDFDWTEERYFQVISDKTASLYAAAARLGGHYAGGDEGQLQALETYGLELGIAFQIVDDCLDLAGDEDEVGKSLGTDLTKGKLTLPLLHLMQQRDGAQRLRAFMQTDAGSARHLDGPEALARLRAEFDLDDAVARAEAEAHRRLAIARGCLDALPAGAARDALEHLTEFVLRRRA